MSKFTKEELVAAGCSKGFAQDIVNLETLPDESIYQFIKRAEKMLQEVEKQNGEYGYGKIENAGISNGQMQSEWDYDGDLLNYHGYTRDGSGR